MRTGLRALLAAAALLGASGVARADDGEIARGKYLVTIGGCNDCHSRSSARQAGFLPRPRRFGSRFCDPRARRLCRPEPDAG